MYPVSTNYSMPMAIVCSEKNYTRIPFEHLSLTQLARKIKKSPGKKKKLVKSNESISRFFFDQIPFFAIFQNWHKKINF